MKKSTKKGSKEHKLKVLKRREKQEYQRFVASITSMEPEEVTEYIKLGLIPELDQSGPTLEQFPNTTPMDVPEECFAVKQVHLRVRPLLIE